MSKFLLYTLLFISLIIGTSICKVIYRNPYSAFSFAEKVNCDSCNDYDSLIRRYSDTVHYYYPEYKCIVASLMKQAGNFRASEYFKKCIECDSIETGSADPLYLIKYADYLFENRGPGKPLSSAAIKCYNHAFNLLDKSGITYPDTMCKLIKRDLLKGYRNAFRYDGYYFNRNRIAHGLWVSDKSNYIVNNNSYFCNAKLKYITSNGGFDEQNDIRVLTGEALNIIRCDFRNSHEIPEIVRKKQQLSINTSIGMRNDYSVSPRIVFNYKKISDGQIAKYIFPDTFTDVSLLQYGGIIRIESDGLSKSDQIFDLSILHSIRKGLVEWYPQTNENAFDFGLNFERGRFISKNKITFTTGYDFQYIRSFPDSIKRNRHIGSISLSMSLYNNSLTKILSPGGITLSLGGLGDWETYDTALVNKLDWGINLNFNNLFNTKNVILNVYLHNGYLYYDNNCDSLRNNIALQNCVSIVCNFNKLKKIGKPQIIPVIRTEKAISGPDDFNNFRAGCDIKLWPSSILQILAGYEYQNFHNIGKNSNNYHIILSTGE